VKSSKRSLAAVLRVAFLDERGEALEAVASWNDARIAELFNAQRLLNRQVRAACNCRLRRSQRYRSVRCYLLGDLQRFQVRCIAVRILRNTVISKAYAEGFGTLYATAGVNEFFGHCGTHDSRKSLSPTLHWKSYLRQE
jgi:hypothetical protein